MARNAFLRIHDHKVQEFLQPGEAVHELVYKTAKLTKYFAQGHINNRTGTLSRMIQVNRPTRAHALAVNSLVFTRTHYALYVHEGTANNGTGYITPKSGAYLTVPKNHRTSKVSGGTLRRAWRNGSQINRGTKPYFTTTAVRGQRANPFLAKGLSEAMAQIR